jgi:antitoxin HicB
MWQYPVKLSRDINSTILVDFPDVAEAHTYGEDEALMHALDALETTLSLYIDDRRDIPKASPVKRRGKFVMVPALTEAKLALYSAMRARRLNWHLPRIDRLLDLLHSSRLDPLEPASRALGKRITIVVEEAA